MAPYSASELKYARPIANALIDCGDFRQWFMRGTPYEAGAFEARALVEEHRGLRSPKIKNPFWFNCFCGKSNCACRIGTGIETDILLIFEFTAGSRLGLHIEVKPPGEALGNGQAESYPRRAACWANAATRPKTVPRHEHFLTVIACSRDLRWDRSKQTFEKERYHDEIARHLSPYPEV